MTTLKRIASIIGIGILLIVLPPLLYGLVTGDDAPGWMTSLTLVALVLLVVGGIIYVAVDAALRHNQRGD